MIVIEGLNVHQNVTVSKMISAALGDYKSGEMSFSEAYDLLVQTFKDVVAIVK